MHDILISHSTKDKDYAFEITDNLEKSGMTIWIAPRNIQRGHIYSDDIAEAITKTKLFLILLSKNAFASRYVKRELILADEDEKEIIPTYIDESYTISHSKNPYRFQLAGIQSFYADMKNPKRSWNKLSDELKIILRNGYKNIESKREPAFWILSANGMTLDLEGMIKNNAIISKWYTGHDSLQKGIKIKDQVIIWLTGIKSGCYAVGEIVSVSKELNYLENEIGYVGVEITTNLTKNPILKKEMQKYQEFDNFHFQIQKPIWRLEKKQFVKILEIREL